VDAEGWRKERADAHIRGKWNKPMMFTTDIALIKDQPI